MPKAQTKALWPNWVDQQSLFDGWLLVHRFLRPLRSHATARNTQRVTHCVFKNRFSYFLPCNEGVNINFLRHLNVISGLVHFWITEVSHPVTLS